MPASGSDLRQRRGNGGSRSIAPTILRTSSSVNGTLARERTQERSATGVYWIPVHDILEARGLEVLLVNREGGLIADSIRSVGVSS